MLKNSIFICKESILFFFYKNVYLVILNLFLKKTYLRLKIGTYKTGHTAYIYKEEIEYFVYNDIKTLQ